MRRRGIERAAMAAAAVWLASLPLGGGALAGCTDAAAPGVNWRRCLQDGDTLSRVDLTGADLRDASFKRTDLAGARLDRAQGRRAKLVQANLAGASLNEASFPEADLTYANLEGASLRGAQLQRARLYEARLRGADLTGASIDGADLLRADLSGALWVDGTTRCAEGSMGQCERAPPPPGATDPKVQG